MLKSTSKSASGEGSLLGLIKFFSKEEHYLAFQAGMSLFRTPHYYRSLDTPGRGDRYDSCLGYWNRTLGDTLPELIDQNSFPLEIDLKNAESLLIHPVEEKHDSWVQCWSAIGSHNEFENSLERMINEFGKYFVILPPKNIEAYAKIMGCSRYGLVNYSSDPLKRSLITKDSSFSYQKEFRFFVGQCAKEEVIDKLIKDSSIKSLLCANATTIKLSCPSTDKDYFFSQGQEKIIIRPRIATPPITQFLRDND